ncbi:MAG: hypothetical protein GYA24_20200 [Candidatus Lokiarchaeota archaeon]|nr:hypothetical protein [Candidatus Lokiarchaeota archaeon]
MVDPWNGAAWPRLEQITLYAIQAELPCIVQYDENVTLAPLQLLINRPGIPVNMERKAAMSPVCASCKEHVPARQPAPSKCPRCDATPLVMEPMKINVYTLVIDGKATFERYKYASSFILPFSHAAGDIGGHQDAGKLLLSARDMVLFFENYSSCLGRALGPYALHAMFPGSSGHGMETMFHLEPVMVRSSVVLPPSEIFPRALIDGGERVEWRPAVLMQDDHLGF